MARDTQYKAEVIESSHELSAREKLMFTDTSNAIPLDSVCEGDSPFVFEPADYAVVKVHNERIKEREGEKPRTDYETYIVVDATGQKYYTSSESFFNSFIEIWDAMGGTNHEKYEIQVYKKESKNFKGKGFITCSIL